MNGSLCLIVFIAVCFSNCVIGSKEHRKLMVHLFGYYDPRILPNDDPREPVHVIVENIHLKRITNIDESKGTVDIALWLGLIWYDPELAWSPALYAGVHKIAVRSYTIWIPDLMLFSGEGVGESALREAHQENDVIVTSTGLVYYSANFKLTLSCLQQSVANGTECVFAFASWTLLMDQLELHLQHKNIDLTSNVCDPNYRVKGATLKEKLYYDRGSPVPWKSVQVRIKLEKKD